MAKDGNTYAKRQRETLKRQKAEAKRDRRRKRKDNPEMPGEAPALDDPATSDAPVSET
jgi:hypothetical protein